MDITEHRRGQQKLAGPGKCRMRHFAAKDLLHAELDGAFKGDGRRHGDHGAWFGIDRTSHGKLERQNRVRVAVRDAVGAAIEGADVVSAGAR